jgi:alpha-amylase
VITGYPLTVHQYAGSTQQHWPFNPDKVVQGYAYILTHPGMPCIFWEHAFDWGHYDALKDLVKVR